MDCYDRFGQPITMEEFGRLHGDPAYKRVASTELPDGTWISTVWLGLNHNWLNDDVPLIFETMVFPSKDDLMEKDMARYSTEEEAIAGHDSMVDEWRSKTGQEL